MARRKQDGPSRSPGLLLGGVSAAIVVLVATIALTAAQSPPPAIAEISPDAAQQIKDAPSEQTSSAGEGAGGGGAGGLTTTTSTTGSQHGPGGSTRKPGDPPEILRARVRRCVGNPPRQIEDPQSPPCVPYFQGDNGGATSRGVTADTIKIAVPTVYNAPQIIPILETFFNKRFEFYGRKLQLVSAGSGNGDCVGSKASAVDLDSQKFFGVLDANSDSNSSCFYSELARRHIMSSNAGSIYTEDQMSALRPYIWQYMMSLDKMFASIGEMVCARLAGGNADHAKGLSIGKPRKFGILVEFDHPEKEPDTTGLEQIMSACGAKPASVYRQQLSSDGNENLRTSQDAMLSMSTKGVTSVICLCVIFQEALIGSYATSQGYFPEWILSSYGANDFNVLIRSVGWPNTEQRTQILGLTVQPHQLNQNDEPAWWMVQEVNPDLKKEQVDQYGTNLLNIYRSMLLMASGLQMAGPHLTPETFERGLQQAKFPNPPDHPNRAGRVGFLDKSHSMTKDSSEFWWSENDPSPDFATAGAGSPGALCYLDRGARRDLGAWPTNRDPFFKFPCFTGAMIP